MVARVSRAGEYLHCTEALQEGSLMRASSIYLV